MNWFIPVQQSTKSLLSCYIHYAHTRIRSDRHLGQFPRTRPVLFVTLWNFLVPYIQSMHLHLSGFAKSSLSLYVKVKSAFNTCHSTYLKIGDLKQYKFEFNFLFNKKFSNHIYFLTCILPHQMILKKYYYFEYMTAVFLLRCQNLFRH